MLSLLDLTQEEAQLKRRIAALKARHFDASLEESKLLNVQHMIERWGTEENTEYRIM